MRKLMFFIVICIIGIFCAWNTALNTNDRWLCTTLFIIAIAFSSIATGSTSLDKRNERLENELYERMFDA